VLSADVNVLVYAHREDAPDHGRYRAWLEESLSGEEPFGVSEFVLSSVIRLATNPRVFRRPDTIDVVLAFADQVRSAPSAVTISPGPRHWDIFTRLCLETRARANVVPDAYLAALAIESGSEWITEDAGFARFRGLRWRHPFAR
jgi:toxin-antitoxin system PIN domain toxin